MSQIPSTSSALNSSSQQDNNSALSELDLDSFIKLMIVELQNQDPLDPMDNDKMLAQISQIREVESTDKLTQTLESVLLGQNIASATNLIGANVEALTDNDEKIEGVVDLVTIIDGEPKVHIEEESIAAPTPAEGDIEAGEYQYRVVWEDEEGTSFAALFPPERGEWVKTTGTLETDRSVLLSNLPETDTPKRIYRTDASGQGGFRLLAPNVPGKQASYLDTASNEELSTAYLTGSQQVLPNSTRSYVVSLNNIAKIKPPK